MATASLQSLVSSQQERDLVSRTVWKIFNAEKEHFKFKVFGIITVDLSDRVRDWIIAKFGPEPLSEVAGDGFSGIDI